MYWIYTFLSFVILVVSPVVSSCVLATFQYLWWTGARKFFLKNFPLVLLFVCYLVYFLALYQLQVLILLKWWANNDVYITFLAYYSEVQWKNSKNNEKYSNRFFSTVIRTWHFQNASDMVQIISAYLLLFILSPGFYSRYQVFTLLCYNSWYENLVTFVTLI
jgi:hypothetical protein